VRGPRWFARKPRDPTNDMRSGATLIAAGGACWLAHTVLMIAGLLAISFAGTEFETENASAAIQSLLAGMPVYLWGLLAVSLGALLVAIGLFVLRTRGSDIVWSGVRGPFGLDNSNPTYWVATSAGRLSFAYGMLSMLGIFGFARVQEVLVQGLPTIEAGSGLPGLRGPVWILFGTWILASLVLVAVSARYAVLLRSLRRACGKASSPREDAFRAYALLGLAGALILGLPLLAVMEGVVAPSSTVLIMMEAGGIVGLFAAPMIGTAAFSLMLEDALWMRRLAPDILFVHRPAAESVTTPVAAARIPGSPSMGYLGQLPALPLPGVDGQAPVVAAAELALDSAATKPHLSRGEVEQGIRHQKAFLLELARRFAEGRVEESSYLELVRRHTERLAELEKELTRTEARPASPTR